ncbi:MAG: threonine dehydratase [Planctomycetaceae bacterium]
MAEHPVSYGDVLAALPRVHAVLQPTPLYEWAALSRLLGCRFFLKHENHQPVGAFKVRGGINLVGTLSDEERQAGILGCSTGNHGQSLAFAARRFGVQCTIVVPLGNNPDKNRSIRWLGADLIEHGCDFDAARGFLERELLPKGARYVHSANEPKLIAGVGTMAIEIFEDLPDPDVILVPIGLGSGVCGTCLVAKHVRPETQVVGVQAEGAPAVAESFRSGKKHTADAVDTWAEGLATRVPADVTLAIMRDLMDDVLLVSDEELRRACCTLLKQTHNLAEGAGAATLAAAFRYRERFEGKTVVGVLSGGNLDLSELPRILKGGELSE